MNINVCLSSDNNYSSYAGIVIASILYNAKDSDNLNFYILDDGISDLQKEKIWQLKEIKYCSIDFIPLSPENFTEYRNVKTHDYIPVSAYSMLHLSSLLPQTVERVIYLDCDVAVNNSLEELFNLDLEGNYAGGVRDVASKKMNKKSKLPPDNKYINSGMVLFDLKKWRESNIEQNVPQFIKEHGSEITCGDQEVLNIVLQGKIKLLPPEWNVQVSNFTNRSDYTKHPKIVHYISRQKPWLYASWNYFTEFFINYRQLTPWALDEKTYHKWKFNGKILSVLKYWKYRPVFFVRPKFWYALVKTYPR